MLNASTALVDYMQNDIQKLGFIYGEPNGTLYGITQESVNLIGIAISSIAITTIAAIGYCCAKWCTKVPVTINITPRPVIQNQKKTLVEYVSIGVGVSTAILTLIEILKSIRK